MTSLNHMRVLLTNLTSLMATYDHEEFLTELPGDVCDSFMHVNSRVMQLGIVLNRHNEAKHDQPA